MQARQQASRVAAQAGPLATSAKETARTSVLAARAWAAPRLESSGQALESRVAPRMSAMMSSAAKRVDPAPSKRRRWPLLIAGLAILAAAAAAILSRRASAAPWRNGESPDDTASTEATPEAANANGSSKPTVHTS
jgi:hypothetical protein